MIDSGPAQNEPSGTLYIVATPIGNLEDLSARAQRVLASVDLIAAEDTRHTGRLLQHLGLSKSMVAMHEHNERGRVATILNALALGRHVALVSDAGTPLISDPGFVLVREVRQAGYKVSPVPGPCALVAALSAAGLPTNRFLFAGFLPAKASGRRSALAELVRDQATLVFYESPHRILDCMADIVTVMGGDRECVLGRELTKAFETFYSGSAVQVLNQLQNDPNGGRGEFVVMVRGAEPLPETETGSLDVDRLLGLLVKELPIKKAARIASEISGLSKNGLYKRALAFKED